MEIVQEQPPEGRRHHDEAYQKLIVVGVAPHPLMYAFSDAGKANPGKGERIGREFPMLRRVSTESSADEDLWLTTDEAACLLDEWQRLRRVCRRISFRR
jgi:hypothetical protein